jgi:hypothetical protein
MIFDFDERLIIVFFFDSRFFITTHFIWNTAAEPQMGVESPKVQKLVFLGLQERPKKLLAALRKTVFEPRT